MKTKKDKRKSPTSAIVQVGLSGRGLGRPDKLTRKMKIMKPRKDPRTRFILERRTLQGKRNNDLRIFSWNLRSLYRPNASLSQYKADVNALQEMRWTRTGFLENSHYTIYYNGNPVNYVFGIGFLFSQKKTPAVISLKS